MWRILLADDHGIYRKGLHLALQRAFPDADLLTADSLPTILSAVEANPDLDLLIIDLHMPSRVPIEGLHHLSATCRNIHLVALSASEAATDILECLACGFHGYISKLQTDEEIIAGIEDVLAGKIYVTPRLALTKGLASWREMVEVTASSRSQLIRLTNRQRDVLALLAQGKSNKEIARELTIAEATVKIHAAAVIRVLGATNRASAALFAQRWLERKEWGP
ncbi:LuxR C-terminal-related transcriptional regulator [Bosea sp. UC22_33]|uniref:LuxR C-terminal-related transcriptional regulator n=1 Tax=Bosea sp. UC22_33 TaxID=3350165 RepID=UPI00366E728F